MSDTSNESSFLETTGFLDWQHDDVQRFTEDAVGDVRDPVQKARLIFTAVRDRIWYDPYSTDDDPEHYRASYVATASRAYCIPKAVLLTAAARAAGIPAGSDSRTCATICRPPHCVPGWEVPTCSSTTDIANYNSTTAG